MKASQLNNQNIKWVQFFFLGKKTYYLRQDFIHIAFLPDLYTSDLFRYLDYLSTNYAVLNASSNG